MLQYKILSINAVKLLEHPQEHVLGYFPNFKTLFCSTKFFKDLSHNFKLQDISHAHSDSYQNPTGLHHILKGLQVKYPFVQNTPMCFLCPIV